LRQASPHYIKNGRTRKADGQAYATATGIRSDDAAHYLWRNARRAGRRTVSLKTQDRAQHQGI
jgi:hypothetical protein